LFSVGTLSVLTRCSDICGMLSSVILFGSRGVYSVSFDSLKATAPTILVSVSSKVACLPKSVRFF